MNARNPYHDRRSNSQLLPRIYLSLQVLIMTLTSYIGYTMLNAMQIEISYIYAALLLANSYIFSTIFTKCKSISKRNSFAKRYNY